MVLIEQALHLGGCKVPIRYVLVPNYARAIHEVRVGKAAMLGQETWELEFDELVYKSIPIIRSGEFRKAIYGRRDNQQLMSASELSDFNFFVALTGQGWWVDIATLQTMGVMKVLQVPEYRLHYKMVAEKRADFGLVEYKSDDAGGDGLPPELAIVPGLAVGLKGSRHFMVSKNHPQGKVAYEALKRGLAILEERGVLKSAMCECGFLNPKLMGWKQINP